MKLKKFELEGLKTYQNDNNNIMPVLKEVLNSEIMILIKLLGDQKKRAEKSEAKYQNSEKEITYLLSLFMNQSTSLQKAQAESKNAKK
jgi:hypothetical protein